ncbi:choloylglycine hydrolase family protein [Enterococcus sp. LJL98]
MCTSIGYQTKNGINFLARTMDFYVKLEAQPIVIPRNHQWTTAFGQPISSRFGYVGTGRKLASYFFADGLNEKGLSGAELYFPNEAKYASEPRQAKLNLAPHEVLSWLLGEISHLAELETRLSEISIVAKENDLLGNVLPLHYILTDPSGKTMVIEPDGQGLRIKNNPVHVLTNSPELEWHLKNLHHYIGLQSENFSPKLFGEWPAKPIGQGSGTFGLPGGYTSAERFVRAAFLCQRTKPAETAEEGMQHIFRILENVTIPRGINLNADGSDDFTQYRSIMNTTERKYYLNNLDSNRLFEVELTEEVLNQEVPIIYETSPGLVTTRLNS